MMKKLFTKNFYPRNNFLLTKKIRIQKFCQIQNQYKIEENKNESQQQQQEKQKNNYKSWFIKSVKITFLLGTCFAVGYYCNEYFRQIQKETQMKKKLEFLDKAVKMGIIKEVFHSKTLTQDLINQIDKYLDKESTQIMFTKLMEDVLKLKQVDKKSTELVLQKVLLQNVLIDKENEIKLKEIFIKIARDEKMKQIAKKAFLEFFETPLGFKVTCEGMSDGLNSKKTISEFKNSIKEFLFDELKDENTKIFLQKSIDNFLRHK